MDSVDLIDVVKEIERITDSYNPTIVYTHHFADLNIDHQITSRAVQTVFRPLPDSNLKKLLFFEVLSATHWLHVNSAYAFVPDYYVDISDFLEKKLLALNDYEDEMREFPHARSKKMVDALAIVRGGMMGRNACESFKVGWIIG